MIIPEKFDTRGSRTESYIKKNFPEFYQYILKNYNEYPFPEALYRYVFHIDTQMYCNECGAPVKFISFSHGYPLYCCSKCANSNKEKLKKQIETIKERLDDPGYKKQFIEKHDETCRKKYGDNYKKEILEKRKNTCLRKYGVEFPLSSEEIRDKVNTSISNRTDDEKQKIVHKTKQTKLKRYGDENYCNIESIKKHNLEKFGVEFPFQSQEIQNKGKLTRLEKFGSIYPLQNNELREKSKNTKNQNYIDSSGIIIDRIFKEDGEYFRCKCPHTECDKCTDKIFDIKCSKFSVRKYDNRELCTVLCPGDTNKGTSIELFIRNILDNHNINYITNNTSILNGKELDIYIPDKNIAIECNGVYWHSLKDNIYHFNKWNECRKKGIQLLTVWEDQIIKFPKIVESIILSKLGIYQRKIYARKCIIKEIPHREAYKFLFENHLQGNVNSSARYGLYYDNELVSLMTFGKKRRALGNKGVQENWELYRFCNKLNTIVVGGASKLLKKFIQMHNPKSIESFSSNDISNGELYNNLGFLKENITKSSYWYIDKNMNRYHRFKFRKSELIKNGWSPSLTEEQIMKNNKFYKIYDSGQTKYILNLEDK